MNDDKGTFINGYWVKVTRQEQDITSKLYAVSPAGNRTLLARPWSDRRLGTVLEVYLEAFSSVRAEEVLSSQINIRLESDDPAYGRSGYLSILDNSPFLCFEGVEDVALPVGDGPYFDRLLEAPLIERLFASERVHQVGDLRRTLDAELHASEMYEEWVRIRYEKEGQLEKFDADLDAVLANGLLERKEPARTTRGNTRTPLTLKGKFSWHP